MFCDQVKAFLSRGNIPYQEKNIAQDETALNELVAMGVYTTPVVKIGPHIIAGFDQAQILKALAETAPKPDGTLP